jgi:nucleoside-diphosphate-sugar epimerase
MGSQLFYPITCNGKYAKTNRILYKDEKNQDLDQVVFNPLFKQPDSELREEIKKQLPRFVFIESKIGEDPDKRNYIISNEKIEKTGFKTQVSLPDGISELIKGYQVIKRNNFSNI